jgi:RNA polymerase sigma factor (sigma-70 family)
MEELAVSARMNRELTRRVSEVVGQERPRLRNWIRRQLANPAEVDDILQDVFVELVVAYRALQPIEDVSAWLFRVARNRITDLFRKKKPAALADEVRAVDAESAGALQELLPALDAGPETAYARDALIDELQEALEDIPREQREVFLAHEIEGLSFKEIAARTGVSVNTLIARKHYAVLHLRERLQALYEEMNEDLPWDT